MESANSSEILTVQADSIVHFRPLFFRPNGQAGDEWIVGHEPSDTAVALPREGVVVIQQLQLGKSVAESSEAARRECGDEVDVRELVQELSELGLVESIDGQLLEEPLTIGQGWLSRIPTPSVVWLCSGPALLIYGLLIVAGPLVFVFDPASRPQAQNLLWNPSYTVDILTLLFLTPLMLFKHELGHLLAARAKGLAAELTFGNRLFYLVAVSRVAGIWTLPRRDRLLIYSAGMGVDCVVAGLLTLMLFTVDRHLFGISPEVRGVLGLIIISEYLGVAWECQIFLKTDLYHIFADLTDQHDLPERSRVLLYGTWRRIVTFFRSSNADLPPVMCDRLTIGYALLLAIGIGGSFFWLFVYLLPATISAVQGEMMRLSLGLATKGAKNMLAILDATLALLFQLAMLLLLLWSVHRSYRSRQLRRIKAA